MNVSEVSTRVKIQFGDESGVQIDDNRIIGWINDALREFAVQNKLFQTRAVVTMTPGLQAYLLPDNLLRLHSVKIDYKNLTEKSIVEIDEVIETADNPSNTSDTAYYYWIYGDSINLYPIPTNPSQLMIYYSKIPDEITDVTSTLPIAEEYRSRLVEYCLVQAYELDENFQAAQLKDQQVRTGLQDMRDAQQAPNDAIYPSITYYPDSRYNAWN